MAATPSSSPDVISPESLAVVRALFPPPLAVSAYLLAALRATPEWKYVEREVDIRLVRDAL